MTVPEMNQRALDLEALGDAETDRVLQELLYTRSDAWEQTAEVAERIEELKVTGPRPAPARASGRR